VSTYYPVCLDVKGKRCVVVGGGEVAERKALSLVEVGARVVVISPDLAPGLWRMRDEGRLVHMARPYQEGDLSGAFLAIAATDDEATNEAVSTEARRRGILGQLRASAFGWLGLIKNFRCSVPIREVLERKRLALRQHESQMIRLLPNVQWPILNDVSNGEFLQCFFQDSEVFRKREFF